MAQYATLAEGKNPPPIQGAAASGFAGPPAPPLWGEAGAAARRGGLTLGAYCSFLAFSKASSIVPTM